MKVLTATCETQGRRDNDYCGAFEGELVYFVPIECDGGSVDDRCGCRRGMAGVASCHATTTIKVAERQDLDPDSYSGLIADAYQKQGYVTEELLATQEVRVWLRQMADELVELARPWSVGTVLERRGDMLMCRSTGDPAEGDETGSRGVGDLED